MSKSNEKPDDSNKKLDVETNELETFDTPLEGELDDEVVIAPVNPRDAMMQRVVDDAVDTRKQAYLDEGIEHPEDKIQVVDKLEIDEPAPEVIAPDPEIVDIQDDSNDTSVVRREGQTFIKVKVDGVEQEVPVGDMVTHYQKNENADAKLGQANNLLNQARALQQPPASTRKDDSTGPVVDKLAVNAAVNKLYDGDVDGAAEDFATLLENQPAQQVDISTQVAAEVARISDHNNLKSSFDRFSSSDDFKHIVSDPTLLGKVNGFTVELQQDQAFMATNPSYEDIFNEAGKRTKEWLNGIAPPSANEENLESRRERKLSKPQAVSPRTARRGPKPEPKVATREDNIAKMARARGQTNF